MLSGEGLFLPGVSPAGGYLNRFFSILFESFLIGANGDRSLRYFGWIYHRNICFLAKAILNKATNLRSYNINMRIYLTWSC